MKKPAVIIVILTLALAAAIFAAGWPHPQRHALVGCWQAEDSTVFIFRDDGTFIGRDFRGRRIFGSWVALNREQIGFQSLLHAGRYAPQYAELTPSGMRYSYSDSWGFIDAVPVDLKTASRQVALASLNQKTPTGHLPRSIDPRALRRQNSIE